MSDSWQWDVPYRRLNDSVAHRRYWLRSIDQYGNAHLIGRGSGYGITVRPGGISGWAVDDDPITEGGAPPL